MISAKALVACLMIASNTYQVPPSVMIGIMHVEGGRIGQESPNTNGSADLGPMQVNTIWLPQLARHWRVDMTTARSWVRDNGCVNVHVAAWILQQKIAEAGYLYGGIARYHSATPPLGQRYAAKVVSVMDKKGLIRKDVPLSTGMKTYQLAQR